jgi:hypothetical protein
MEPIEFVLDRSPLLTVLLILFYTGTLAVWLFIDLFPYAPLILVIILKIAGSLALFPAFKMVKIQARKSDPESVILLWHDSKGRWGCKTKRGHLYSVSLLKSSYIGSYFLILRFKSVTKTFNLLICRDMLTPSAYRLLGNRLTFY